MNKTVRDLKEDLIEKRREAGRAGGLATLARHGKKHMQKIGRKGAKALHTIYKLIPIAQNDFAMVRRDNGELKAYVSGRNF